jgi:hypothetical protein
MTGKYRNAVLAALVLLAVMVPVYCAVVAHIKAQTIATYDAQKRVVDAAIVEFALQLEADGCEVINTSTGTSGSGEWRTYAVLTATDSEGRSLNSDVEIMGFVSHGFDGQPTWVAILPMRLSDCGQSLNAAFLELLGERLTSHGWKYTIDSRCRDLGPSSVPIKRSPPA